jgi:hypothetical protein
MFAYEICDTEKGKIIRLCNESNDPYLNSLLEREWKNERYLCGSKRIEIVSWIVMICKRSSLENITLFTAISLFDIFTSRIRVTDFELYACAAILLSSKINEEQGYEISMSLLRCYVMDRLTERQIYAAEMEIFNIVCLDSLPITAGDFLFNIALNDEQRPNIIYTTIVLLATGLTYSPKNITLIAIILNEMLSEKREREYVHEQLFTVDEISTARELIASIRRDSIYFG